MDPRYKLILILPYFGKFNNYFPLYLDSCRFNPTINWLIFTDDKRDFNYPRNVRVIYLSFKDFRDRIQQKFDFKISLSDPYRLCNFRPAFGEIFNKYIRDYDFWGYCDSDMIWGDIRRFITDDILNKYNKIHELGHMSLIRNSKYYNELYKYNDAYKIAFSENYNLLFFDEHGFNDIFRVNEDNIYRHKSIADFNPRKYNFRLNEGCTKNDISNANHIYTWEAGNLLRYYVKGNKILTEDVLYIHFLKRKMKVSAESNAENFAIIPNEIVKLNGFEFTPENIIEISQNRFYKEYWTSIFTINSLRSKLIYRVIIEPKRKITFNKIRTKIHLV